MSYSHTNAYEALNSIVSRTRTMLLNSKQVDDPQVAQALSILDEAVETRKRVREIL